VPDELQWLCDNVPHYWNWYCFSGYYPTIQIRGLFLHDRKWQAAGGKINERNDKLRATILAYIQEKIGDRPDLVAKSIPSYAPWGRRMVIDSGWYDALRRDNVDLVTSKISRITANGVVTADGVEHELDALVFATGFQTSRYLSPVQYLGRNGATLEQLWSVDGPRAHLAMVMPGFPNFFMLYGAPNSQPTAGSMCSWIEIWSRYIAKSLVMMLENGWRKMECKREAYERYNRDLDVEMSKLIWEQEGIGSYFVNEFGRQGTNMPFEIDGYFLRIQSPDPADYLVE
jgi:4-hydroxyacetophenone monooxygenase